MGASNYPGLALPKPTPSVLERGWKKAAKETALDKAYRLVDERDGSVCWCTGKKLSPFADQPDYRREHHHLNGRVGKHRADPNGIITVSARVHALITSHALEVVGSDARRSIRFKWNRALVPNKSKEPFRLRRQVNGERAS
jgi:hypothetical protein